MENYPADRRGWNQNSYQFYVFFNHGRSYASCDDIFFPARRPKIRISGGCIAIRAPKVLLKRCLSMTVCFLPPMMRKGDMPSKTCGSGCAWLTTNTCRGRNTPFAVPTYGFSALSQRTQRGSFMLTTTRVLRCWAAVF